MFTYYKSTCVCVVAQGKGKKLFRGTGKLTKTVCHGNEYFREHVNVYVEPSRTEPTINATRLSHTSTMASSLPPRAAPAPCAPPT